MQYRYPNSKEERELLQELVRVSHEWYSSPWHPRLPKEAWQAAFVRADLLYIRHLSRETGAWADWSLKRGMPLLVPYPEWLVKNIGRTEDSSFEYELAFGETT